MFTKEDAENSPNLADPSSEVLFPNISDITFSVEGKRQLLSNLDTNKASGPDEIPSFILNQFAVEISPILQVIFTKSLSSDFLPSDWKKQTFVQSLRKVGEMKQVIIDRYPLLLYAQKQWNTSFFTT